MELLSANLGKVRRDKMGGRDYLVAPITLIVPGVLNGSRGALYYPEDEVAKNADAWNGMPIVMYHPQTKGRHTSARTREVIDTQGIGMLLNATANGKLTTEGWFEVDRVKAVDNRLGTNIFDRLSKGQPIEVSTGLFTENKPADEGAEYNGKPYTHIARNYKPDHLAILPDLVGACSIDDGCGVMVNEGDDLVENDWSDAARDAAAEARRGAAASKNEDKTVKKSSVDAKKASFAAQTKSTNANDRVSHEAASAAHRTAARANQSARDTHIAAGNPKIAELHDKASDAHKEAATLHAQRASEGGRDMKMPDHGRMSQILDDKAKREKGTHNEDTPASIWNKLGRMLGIANGGPGSGPHPGSGESKDVHPSIEKALSSMQHVTTGGQADQHGQNHWFNDAKAQKDFPRSGRGNDKAGHKVFGAAVKKEFEKRQGTHNELAHQELPKNNITANDWSDAAREAAAEARKATSQGHHAGEEASKHANAASSAARSRDTVGAHESAMDAHTAAAKEHYATYKAAKSVGASDVAKIHYGVYKAHQAAAKKHGFQISYLNSSTKNEGGNRRSPQTSNKENAMLTAEQREEIVEDLTANCDCWKGENDADVLNEFDDEKLVALRDQSKSNKRAEKVLNAAKKVKVGDGALVYNEKSGAFVPSKPVKNADDEMGEDDEDDEDEDDMDKKKGKGKKSTKNQRQEKPPTVEEWLAASKAPASVVSAVRNSIRVENEERERLMEQLETIANERIEDEEKREKFIANLADAPLDSAKGVISLRDMEQLLPQHRNQEQESYQPQTRRSERVANYSGSAPARNGRRTENTSTPLTIPRIDWTQVANENRARENGERKTA